MVAMMMMVVVVMVVVVVVVLMLPSTCIRIQLLWLSNTN